jgi:hypothetical protein
MDALASITKRFEFTLPAAYKALLDGGHLGMPWETYVVFDDFEWLAADAIAEYEFSKYSIASDGGFVPFAINGGGNPWCWRMDWTANGVTPVAFCEGEKGLGYAPDFRGFLFRKALEEFAGANDLASSPKKHADLRRAVDIVAPHLPAAWTKRLRELAGHEMKKWQKGKFGELFVLPKDELNAIVAKELAFPHLDEKFIEDKELLKRAKKK